MTSLDAEGPEQPAPAPDAGYARTVQPIAARTAVRTDDRGLTAGDFRLPVRDGEIPAYRALPSGGDKLPVLLVVCEIFGGHEHIKDICRRLAKLGYLAIAPELFARQGDPRQYDNIEELRDKITNRTPDKEVLADLDAAAAWAVGHGGDGGRLGITGFCWGGRITWLYAAHNPAVKAAVAWYGRLVGAASDLAPRHPVDVADDLKAPVLGLYGGADPSIPLDTVEAMQARLRASANPASRASEIVVYDGAPHAFHADYRPTYRAAPAADGWRRLQAWFKTLGV